MIKKKNFSNGPQKEYKKTTYAGLHKIICPEKVVLNEILTFSVNPVATPYKTKRKGERVLNLPPFLNSIIKRLSKLRYCDYKLNPEISCNGKWHFHGEIKITEIINFYCFDLPLLQELGAFEIDTIKDIEIWRTYCTKLKELTEPYLRSLKINYEINKNSKYYPEDPLVQMELEEDDEIYLRENLIESTYFKGICPQSDIN